MITEAPQVVWFKRDLRLDDHLPLSRACLSGAILPLYIVEPDYWCLPDVSRRHWHFVHDSLIDLQQAFNRMNVPFAIRTGVAVNVMHALYLQYGNFTLWSHEETGNKWTYERDKAVALWCQQQGVIWHEFPSNGVVRRLKNQSHWTKQRADTMTAALVVMPDDISAAKNIKTDELPAKDDAMFGVDTIGHIQRGGVKQALKVLDSFLRFRSQRYILAMSKPDDSARHCSRLSAHIAYGNLSVRQIEHAVRKRLQELPEQKSTEDFYLEKNLNAFLSRLIWRCHFVQKFELIPAMEYACLDPAFEGMRESYFRADFFAAWKEGRTGYPLIDACMRCLHQNGWITFRMRAVLVSFASYHLWLDWRITAPFLARLFTDYEPGIHYAQFQMQSGVTAMNAIRMYNPIKQSEEHDPGGLFIRKYIPELKHVSEEFIHEPWLMPEPPIDYPHPIVDHEIVSRFAREQVSKRHRSMPFAADSEGSNNVPRRQKKNNRKKKNPQLSFDI